MIYWYIQELNFLSFFKVFKTSSRYEKTCILDKPPLVNYWLKLSFPVQTKFQNPAKSQFQACLQKPMNLGGA